MDLVTIFMTNTLGSRAEEFVHDGTRYVFERIDCNGPARLAEGQVWVFIDWVLEECAGLSLCRRLRADPRIEHAHITMVLEQDDDDDRRRALKAGADDYIVGPVDRNGVLDRILALQSPQEAKSPNRLIALGKLTIDLVALQASWAKVPLVVGPNEFRLLRFFAENPHRVLSRRELIAGLGKVEPAIDERTVDVWIGRLRRALRNAGAGDPLRTVRSKGYVYDG